MAEVVKERTPETTPPHPSSHTQTKRPKQLSRIGLAGIATAVLAVIGGVGYGSYELTKSKTRAEKQQSAAEAQKTAQQEEEKKRELLRKLKSIVLEIITKFKNGKIILTLPIENSKISVGGKSFSVLDIKTGDTYVVGPGEFETEVKLVLDINGEKVTYSAKAYAIRGEESSYALTFNQE